MSDIASESEVKAEYKGVKAVLDRALQSYEKLPMLEIVFERLIRLLNTSLRNLTSESTEIDITNFSSLRFSNYQTDHADSGGAIGLFKVIEWDNLGMIKIDDQLVINLVDILLGGKKNSRHGYDSSKTLTSIEQNLIQQIIESMLTELAMAFEPVSPASFVFERLESNTNFATIARPGDAVILLQLHVKLDGRSGNIDLVLPYATIEPIKPQLQQVFLGDKFGVDASWESKMLDNIHTIDMPLDAVVAKQFMPVEKVVNLKVGDTIVVDHKKDEDISLVCGGIELFKAKIGKVDDKVAVHITDLLLDDED